MAGGIYFYACLERIQRVGGVFALSICGTVCSHAAPTPTPPYAPTATAAAAAGPARARHPDGCRPASCQPCGTSWGEEQKRHRHFSWSSVEACQ